MTRDPIRWIRAVILLGFAGVIAKLFLAGEMVRYMTPSLDLLTTLTGVVLAVMGLMELRGNLPGPPLHGPDAVLTYLALVLPLALGLLVTPRALGSGALAGEPLTRLVLAFAPGPRPEANAPPPIRPIDDTDDLLAYLRQVGEAGVGERVRVTGTVLRGDGFGRDEFALLRYSIVHCVADARPIVLLVVGLAATAFSVDQWVQVEGRLASKDYPGGRLVAIIADQVTPVAEPPNPYLHGGP
jgi:putative membrane protein